MTLVNVAATEGYLTDRQTRFLQEFFGTLHSQSNNVPMRCDPHFLLEQARKMKTADACFRGELIQCQGICAMLLHKFEHSQETTIRKLIARSS